MAEIIVQNQVLGTVATNTYFLMNPDTKEMLLVEKVDDKEFLAGLLRAMYEELPEPKPKKRS